MPLLTYFFLGWVGLGLAEFVGFMIIDTCFQPNIICYIANSLVLLAPSAKHRRVSSEWHEG